MRTPTDMDIICTINWLQLIFRGRDNNEYDLALRHLDEVDKEVRRIVDAPRTATEQLEEVPNIVTRLRAGRTQA